MSSSTTQQSGINTPAEPISPQAAPSIDYSLEAPAGIEQPYLARMVPLTTATDDDADGGVAKRSVGAYGVGWSMVQGPPSLFAAGSPWVGWRQ